MAYDKLWKTQSSQAYLGMASWAEIQLGSKRVTAFFSKHSDEEHRHMLKLIHYSNERGGFAVVPSLSHPALTFLSLKKAFEELLRHKLMVRESINELVDLSLREKDYATHNFCTGILWNKWKRNAWQENIMISSN